VKERPILFSAPMVRAILAGTKTQTRRVYKPRESSPYEIIGENEDGYAWPMWFDPNKGPEYHEVQCPYGSVGDRLWVKETFVYRSKYDRYYYRADSDFDPYAHSGWKPSIFMPRKASRITLEITEAGGEHLHEISASECIDEGINPSEVPGIGSDHSLVSAYEKLWDSINAKKAPWSSNPFVWVISFQQVNALAERKVSHG
jgi:hypothetical protein